MVTMAKKNYIYSSALKGEPFITRWAVSGDASGRTVVLPFLNIGTYDATVLWGDGKKSRITSYNDPDATHIYDVDGSYDIMIYGSAPGWYAGGSAYKTKLIKVLNWGDGFEGFLGFSSVSAGFLGCTNLDEIATGAIKQKAGTTITTITNIFQGCTKITSIPVDLLSNLAGVTNIQTAFNGTRISSIPEDLFINNTFITNATGAFNGITTLLTVPEGLLRNQVNLTNINGMFAYCSNLEHPPQQLLWNSPLINDARQFVIGTKYTYIPIDFWRYCPLITNLSYTYALRQTNTPFSVPVDLFRYNTEITTFENTFDTAHGITITDSDMFRYNTKVTTFYECFKKTFEINTGVYTIPNGLFRYNTLATIFNGCFSTCPYLIINPQTFCLFGEESTRFLNKSVNFSSCFSRTTYGAASPGTAPDLWNYDFGTGTPVTTSCFAGAGNNLTSLTNYADIPAAWK